MLAGWNDQRCVPTAEHILRSLTEDLGIYTKLFEQSVRVAASHKRIIPHEPNGEVVGMNRPSLHQVFAVKLKDGHDYIIDLAGAQFGHYQAVMPMAAYYPKLVISVPVPHRPFGGLREARRETLSELVVCQQEHDMRILVVQDKIAAKLEALVGDWEQAKGITLEKLICQAAPTAEHTSDQLFSYLRSELRAFVEQSHNDGNFTFERLPGYKEPTFMMR